MRKCLICGKQHYAKDMCKKHYHDYLEMNKYKYKRELTKKYRKLDTLDIFKKLPDCLKYQVIEGLKEDKNENL